VLLLSAVRLGNSILKNGMARNGKQVFFSKPSFLLFCQWTMNLRPLGSYKFLRDDDDDDAEFQLTITGSGWLST